MDTRYNGIMESGSWGNIHDNPADEKEWILLVDDDPQLRRSMREFLETSGFSVLEARNSYDGLFTLAQHGLQIRLIITEVNLLPVGGIKLAENALRLFPHLQVLCMSTGVDEKGMQYWMRYLGAQFLQKPFSPFQLHEKVHLALGRHIEDAAISILDYQSTMQGDPDQVMSTDDPGFWMEEI